MIEYRPNIMKASASSDQDEVPRVDSSSLQEDIANDNAVALSNTMSSDKIMSTAHEQQAAHAPCPESSKTSNPSDTDNLAMHKAKTLDDATSIAIAKAIAVASLASSRGIAIGTQSFSSTSSTTASQASSYAIEDRVLASHSSPSIPLSTEVGQTASDSAGTILASSTSANTNTVVSDSAVTSPTASISGETSHTAYDAAYASNDVSGVEASSTTTVGKDNSVTSSSSLSEAEGSDLSINYDQIAKPAYQHVHHLDTCPLFAEDDTSKTLAPAVSQLDIDCIQDLLNGLADRSGISASLSLANEQISGSSIYHAVQNALKSRNSESFASNDRRIRALEKAKLFANAHKARQASTHDDHATDTTAIAIQTAIRQANSTGSGSQSDASAATSSNATVSGNTHSEKPHSVDSHAHTSEHKTLVDKACGNASMKAQYSFDRKISFPGFGLYDLKRNRVFLDKHAVSMLDLDEHFISKWIHPLVILRVLGRGVTHKVMSYMRTLKDSDKDFINPCLTKDSNVCPYTVDSSTVDGRTTDEITIEDLTPGPAQAPIMGDPNELLRAIGCPMCGKTTRPARLASIAPMEIASAGTGTAAAIAAAPTTGTVAPAFARANTADNLHANAHSSALNPAQSMQHDGKQLIAQSQDGQQQLVKAQDGQITTELANHSQQIDKGHFSANSFAVPNNLLGPDAGKVYTGNMSLAMNFDTVASSMEAAAVAAKLKESNKDGHNIQDICSLGFGFGLFGVAPTPVREHDPNAIMPETKCTEMAKSHLELTHSNGDLYRRYAPEYLPGEHSRDRASFSVFLNHGSHAGTKVYVKLNALFENGELSHITIALTRVASYLFAMLPHVAAESASFDWLTSSGELIFGSNYYSMLGYTKDDPKLQQLKSNWHRAVVHPDDSTTLEKEKHMVLSDAHGNNFEFLYRSRCRDGSYIWTKTIGTVVARNKNKQATRILGINIDINRVIEGYENLQSKVFTDILTGLKNRTYLTTHLPEIIANTAGFVSVIFTDVTALKAYNDYLGHAVGDRLLCSAAILINNALEGIPNELIRISGDEIVCILPNCDAQQAQSIVQKLDNAVKEYNINAPVRMPVFFSCGAQTVDLSSFAGRKLDGDDLDAAMEKIHLAIQDADKIMQTNKQAAHKEHYELVKAYIEQSLKQKIEFNDKRLFA